MILKYLKKDEIENIDIINFIENYQIDYVEKIGDSILHKGTSDRRWVYISNDSIEELKVIKSRLGNE
ncbi:hypothetical protein [Clostridium cellulovorans]|uniref:hypothetical protein n=1 Tax=Clostridium cellulovorans TaxID=1493 RepID=UPI0001A975F1|nr:hypothetical protein [Clostridium cellulovorans]